MTEDRVVVEVDLAVEREELVVLGGDEGIDLQQRSVRIDVSLVKPDHELHRFIDLRWLQSEREGKLARLIGLEADRRVDISLLDSRRILRRDLFNLHAAGLRRHEDQLARLRDPARCRDRARDRWLPSPQ